ncbi:MAG TPA: DNA methyltransferase [Bryocella sp.]|nr:DNA methyltransferase [Bryocella sp.]
MPLDILNFVRKWQQSSLTERSAYQQHFRDLCEALGVPHPTEQDVDGSSYTFEKHVPKTGTDDKGFADVWKRGYFGWEYKSKGGDLKKAYRQLNDYQEALLNPPLGIVCDFDRFEVHTRFENLPPRVYAFTLEDLLHARDTPTCSIPPLEVLRHVFGDFNQLRPDRSAARVTEAAAADFLKLAQQLELERAADPNPPTKEQIAHFLMRLVFCLFADSVELIPNHAFRNLISNDRFLPSRFNRKLPDLLEAMSSPEGFFGADDIPWFNGDLFKPNDHMIVLNKADLGILYDAAQHDWSHIEPSIFGTLFERSLDAAKRSLIGAHYTSPEDILLLVEPVIMQPLYRRWADVQQAVLAALAEEESFANPESGRGTPSGVPNMPCLVKGTALAVPYEATSTGASAPEVRSPKRATKPRQPTLLNRPALDILQNWAAELSSVRVLDPACGSGNFLYITLKRLLDLWHEARVFAIHHGLTLAVDPMPNPAQLFGIETDFYAHEIASIVVWIGFLQWKHDHGVEDHKTPLLRKLTNIEHGDAIMRYDETEKSLEHPAGKPYEPEWPAVDYVVGNPPFLGGNKLRKELGDTYVNELFRVYEGRVPQFSDLVCYWFEKGRKQVLNRNAIQIGLIATQGIRGGVNRTVLENIAKDACLFYAWSDRPWILDGASVRISLIAFAGENSCEKFLDGKLVNVIHADLTSEANTRTALKLDENEHLCFMGPSPKASFDIEDDVARKMLSAPINVNGRPNSDVVRPVVSAIDLVRNHRQKWTVDFGSMTLDEAAGYEMPFEYVKYKVKPERERNSRAEYIGKWWQYGRPRVEMRAALAEKHRFIATPAVAKHRIFVWLRPPVLSNQGTLVFAREDDYFIGVLSSDPHKIWAIHMGTALEDRPRYTPTTSFETFPFPWPPGKEPANDPRFEAIAAAARELVAKRDAWLNPPGITEADLKKRTLTNLYNQLPTWLSNLHRALDEAVFAAYGWPSTLTDTEILERLLALNHERAAKQ